MTKNPTKSGLWSGNPRIGCNIICEQLWIRHKYTNPCMYESKCYVNKIWNLKLLKVNFDIAFSNSTNTSFNEILIRVFSFWWIFILLEFLYRKSISWLNLLSDADFWTQSPSVPSQTSLIPAHKSFWHLSLNLLILKDLVDFIVQHLIASIFTIVSFPSLNLLAFFIIGKFGQHYHI